MRDISSKQRTFITKRNADDGSQDPRVLIKLQAGHTHHGSYSNSVLGIDNCCIQFQNQVQTSIILNMSATLFSKWHFVTLKETFEDSVLVAFHLNLTKLYARVRIQCYLTWDNINFFFLRGDNVNNSFPSTVDSHSDINTCIRILTINKFVLLIFYMLNICHKHWRKKQFW